ncbi:MAG: hypothetical protein AB1801_25610 [Chloroflexota bacterium]
MENTENNRQIPFDQPIKILLLALHATGFSGWFGGVLIGGGNGNVPSLFPALANVSGVLPVLRELYKDGWQWLIYLEGGLTIFKVMVLILCILWQSGAPLLLGVVLICGLLTSHLPKEIKERRLIRSLAL